jgi:ABC-2 type transport system permease protein
VIGKTLGSVTVALLQGTLVVAVCLAAGFRPLHWLAVPRAFLYMILIALVFAGLGTAIGSRLQDMQGFQLIMNFLVLPIFFLSGALFPLEHLPKALGVITSADPLSYGIDGLRGTLIGLSHFGLLTDLWVLAAVAVVLLSIGSYLFSKIEL